MFRLMIEKEVAKATEKLRHKIMKSVISEISENTHRAALERVDEMFRDTRDVKGLPGERRIRTLGAHFKIRVLDAVSAEVESTCKEAAKELITGEKFLDAVVARIKNKQL